MLHLQALYSIIFWLLFFCSSLRCHVAEYFGATKNAAEHFLTYLPHSGYSNQIISFLNAISLAFILNRTLVVPPLFLGDDVTFPWSPFDHLNYTIATALDGGTKASTTTAILNFTTLFPQLRNFTKVSLVLYSELKTSDLVYRGVLKDYGRYNYKYVLSDANSNDQTQFRTHMEGSSTIIEYHNNTHYKEKYPVSIYAGSPHSSLERSSILHIGSLFGRDRIQVSIENQTTLLQYLIIRQELTDIFANPAIPCISERRLQAVLGFPYFSLHLRGEFPFSSQSATMSQLALELLTKKTSLYNAFKSCILKFGSLSDRCLVFLNSKEEIYIQIPLYVATDIKNFRNSSEYTILAQKFKKILILDDILDRQFQEEIKSCLKESNTIRLLYPLVDQVIAANGLIFSGSRGSTFSQLIHKMHLYRLKDENKP